MTEQPPSAVVQSLCDDLVNRERVGRIEYGADMDRQDLPASRWFAEWIAEQLDGLNYARKLQQDMPRLEAAVRTLEREGWTYSGGTYWAPDK